MESASKSVEIKITVPWGHVAAETWGNANGIVVLCFHGIMDNAGSFSRLIPYLPDSFYYVCIDLPGHGRSSFFPAHLPIHTINYLLVYKLVAIYFKQKRYIIIGHSYGGQLGYLFAQLYPEFVEKLVMLETISMTPVSSKNFKDYLLDKLETHLEIEEKLCGKKPPSYTFEKALERIQQQRKYGLINKKAAEALLGRSIEPTDDGLYRFNFDQRLKNFINPLRDFRYVRETNKSDPVRCPVLMILGRGSEPQQIYMRPVLEDFKRMKNFVIEMVDGNHDVHNTNPERVAPYILKFLQNQKSKF